MLKFSHLEKSFGSLKALNDVSFDVPEGEIVGFVGANGAGKSTSMRIAMGTVVADAGQVTWRDEPMNLAIRRRVGYMPEERGLYPKMKVADQLVYLARLHGMSTPDAQAAMETWTKRLGVDARQNDEVQKLSLGNQQRVQLAASLVHNPDILILDEPFSGLDPLAVDVMSSVLHERSREGVSVLFSSHQLDLLERICDRVVIIQSGEIVANGTVSGLQSNAQVEYRIEVAAPRHVVEAVITSWPQDHHGTQGAESTDSSAFSTADIKVTETDNGSVFTYPLPEGMNIPDLLASAQAIGPVLDFARRRPNLVEMYREVVHAQDSVESVTEHEGGNES
ncbi:ABC transporter ATP-binding protein [Actinomyces vulturis]|uniref:ABC transporter ATP-binding protein n=1 Tax=Actinomyces vulturis TaxID=1857645 RepID=UPI00082A2681|nr:ATP-binding cassette domain-containing protein [Actinomyces vulturis]